MVEKLTENNYRMWLHDYTTVPKQLEVRFRDNGTKMALGKGTINLSINTTNMISISNVITQSRWGSTHTRIHK